MLNRKEVLVRYIIAVALFVAAGTGMVTGKAVTLCSIIGAVELGTAMVRYSPLMEILEMIPIEVHITKKTATTKSLKQ